jgi:hypothetical protein
MYATDSDGCPSRGCWNFLPIASKFVRKIWREGEAESYTWQRRGRDKRHKDKTNTLFMRRNNQRHRFARRRRAALQPARLPGGYQIQTLLRYSPSLLIDSSFSRIHIVMLLQLPACLPEGERERASQSFHSYVAHRNLQNKRKILQQGSKQKLQECRPHFLRSSTKFSSQRNAQTNTQRERERE